MEKRQRLLVVQRPHLRHEPGEQVERPVRLGDEGAERLPPVAAFPIVAPLDQRALGRGLPVGRRQPDKSQMVAALKMVAAALEPRLPLLVDQP